MRDPVTAPRGDLMRVLGVDPGLTRCGLGVVDGLPGRQPRVLLRRVHAALIAGGYTGPAPAFTPEWSSLFERFAR